MIPEQIVGYFILAVLLVVGAFALHRRRDHHEEPDQTPLGVWRPTPEQAAIMAEQHIGYLDAADMNGDDWAAARDTYHRTRRF